MTAELRDLLCDVWQGTGPEAGARAVGHGGGRAGGQRATRGVRKGKKSLRGANMNERSRGRFLLPGHGTFSPSKVGRWRLAVGGGWRRLAVGDWWLVGVGGWRLVTVGSGWRLAVGGSWRLAVSGWRRLAVGDWRLVVPGVGP